MLPDSEPETSQSKIGFQSITKHQNIHLIQIIPSPSPVITSKQVVINLIDKLHQDSYPGQVDTDVCSRSLTWFDGVIL